jgi:predicted dehydrogenase
VAPDKQPVAPDKQPVAPDKQPVAPGDRVVCHRPPQRAGRVVCGVIGAGSFAQIEMLPGLCKAGARIKWIASSRGLSGSAAARKFPIERSTSDADRILDDPEVQAVLIATRHDTHARLVIRALQAGKAVFVEKPLCLSSGQLDEIVAACRRARAARGGPPLLMVGYNRRFAPLVSLARSYLDGRILPLAMTLTCNAGAVPPDHWVHNPEIGGGRLLGEACHFVDLLHFLAGEAPIVRVAALGQGGRDRRADTAAITLAFADGSLGQINYFTGGAKSYPKERLEIFSEGRVLVLDNFRRLTAHGFAARGKRSWTQDKGHRAGFRAFVDAVANGHPSPIPMASLIHTTQASLAAFEALRSKQTVVLGATGGCHGQTGLAMPDSAGALEHPLASVGMAPVAPEVSVPCRSEKAA